MIKAVVYRNLAELQSLWIYISVKQFFVDKNKMSLTEEDITKLKEKFAELDKDGSGKISLTELKAAIEKRGGKFNDEMFDMLGWIHHISTTNLE